MKSILLTALLLSVISLNGQDIYFSQFEATPIQLNPASTGSNGSYELLIGYRSQWKQLNQRFTTPVATGILPLFSKTNQIKGGIGFTALSQNQGNELAYKNSGGGISFSYGLNFKKVNLFGGFSSSFFQRSLNGNFATGSQYDAGYDPNLSNEESSYQSKSYFDLGTGLYLCDKSNVSYLGIAAHHVTQPNVGLASSDKLLTRFTVHGGYQLMRKSNTPITPEFVLNYQNGLQRTLVGAKVNYQFKGEKGFAKDLSLGILGRYAINDAFIFGLSVSKKHLTLGISQDFTISKVSAYNNSLGATELMLCLKIKSKRTQSKTENYTYNQAREFVTKREEEKDNVKAFNLHIEESVRFAFNDSTITDEGKRLIENVSHLLMGNKYFKVRIIGHSDNLGTKKRNLQISETRAKMVAEYLISKGIDRKRIQIIAKGDSEPIKPNDTEEGRALNRRVEFELYK